MQSLYTAASGMAAQERNVDVISNNIANMRTPGFKRQRADFQDLMYRILDKSGAATSEQATIRPVGTEIGTGVKTVATSRLMSQGPVDQTDQELDLAISGEGFFPVNLPDGRTAYTRAGNFQRAADGTIVTSDGFAVGGGITIPDGTNAVSISADGVVEAYVAGASTPTQVGRIQLARFTNAAGLESYGQNLFLETASSGVAQLGNPTADGMGKLMQNYLESSNSNAVTEVANLIAAQRAYEMNARVISGADQMMQSTSQLR